MEDSKKFVDDVFGEEFEDDEEFVCDPEVKEGFLSKVKNGAKKVKDSKAVKVITAAGLVAAGAAGALFIAGKSRGDQNIEIIDLGEDGYMVTDSSNSITE